MLYHTNFDGNVCVFFPMGSDAKIYNAVSTKYIWTIEFCIAYTAVRELCPCHCFVRHKLDIGNVIDL